MGRSLAAAMVGGGRLFGDWKKWFPGVFALFYSTDAPLYCKNDLILSQNALSTEVFFFIWFLANAEAKFHISVKQWARKRYIARKLYIMTLFLTNLNTYNCHNNLIFWYVKIWLLNIEIPRIFFLFFWYYRYKKVNLQNFAIFLTVFLQQLQQRRWIIFACENYIFC